MKFCSTTIRDKIIPSAIKWFTGEAQGTGYITDDSDDDGEHKGGDYQSVDFDEHGEKKNNAMTKVVLETRNPRVTSV